MYKKLEDDDDGILESMNDKRTSCILLLGALMNIIENIRCKVLSLNDLDLLEEMVTFTRRIYLLIQRAVGDYCKEKVYERDRERGLFYPLIRQARQMEIHGLLCDMAIMLNGLKKKRYFHKCNKVYVLNAFVRTLRPSSLFLQRFLVKHQHFHVKLLPPPKKQPRYYQKYY